MRAVLNNGSFVGDKVVQRSCYANVSSIILTKSARWKWLHLDGRRGWVISAEYFAIQEAEKYGIEKFT